MPRRLRIETVADCDRLGRHYGRLHSYLSLLHFLLGLLYATLQVVNFQLGRFTRISAPYLASLGLVGNAMDRFLLLVVGRDASCDFLLDKARIGRQEGQLACVEHLLLFFDLLLELSEALAVEGHESQVLAREALRLLTQVNELGVDGLLQVFDMDHDLVDSLVNVLFDLVEGFANVRPDPLVVKLVAPKFMILQLLNGLAQAVNLSCGLFLVHVDILLDVQHALVDLFRLFLHLTECLASLA